MARLNLVNAETLCWIARLGTFTAAAERLFTTQSAVSARMRELEQSLGVPLFERRGRRLELTVSARRFVERIEPLLQELENALNDPDSLSATAGTVRIGMGEVTMTWFARLIPHLRKALPRVSFQIEMDFGYKLKQLLEDGQLDLAIVSGRMIDERFVSQQLGATRMIWAMSPSLTRDAAGTERPLSDILRTTPLWCVTRSSSFFPEASRALRQAGANLDNVCTCNSLNGLIELVEHGEGIAQLPELMIVEQLEQGSMIALTEELGTSSLGFTIVRHKSQQQEIIHSIMRTIIDRSVSVPGLSSSDQLGQPSASGGLEF